MTDIENPDVYFFLPLFVILTLSTKNSIKTLFIRQNLRVPYICNFYNIISRFYLFSLFSRVVPLTHFVRTDRVSLPLNLPGSFPSSTVSEQFPKTSLVETRLTL